MYISNYTMNEDDYEMSQFVIGFDGGGGSDGNIIDGSSVDGAEGELYFGMKCRAFNDCGK